MLLRDRAQAGLIHATARFSVRYGNNLRFAGADLPKPATVRIATRHGRVPVHVYRPRDPAGRLSPVHIHFHGGAWLMRFPQMDDWWCRYLVATAGVAVLNVDFRTGPYVAYPVAQEQCHDVVAHVAASGPELGLDPLRISVGGFSSGGGLAASVCLQTRDAGTARPVLQVLGVPALDLAGELPEATSMISRSFRDLVRRVYFPDPATRSHPYASPLLAPDLSGLPPAVVCTAELDSLRADGDRYAARLGQAGVPVQHDVTPGVDHYFLTQDPGRARQTMAMIAAAIAGAAPPA
ncbi:MAG TPA: alpha/beta hydrolase [Sporichthya sp.]|nr:alpha/beta hydrolase [Sporichthya sp.]